MRLPHDIIVEEGLEPNPGPSSSRSTGEPQEKKRSLQETPEEEVAEEDDGFSPAYYKLGKGEAKGEAKGVRTEEEQGEKDKTHKAFEKSETPFTDKKRKVGTQKDKTNGNNFFNLQKLKKGTGKSRREGRGSTKATPCRKNQPTNKNHHHPPMPPKPPEPSRQSQSKLRSESLWTLVEAKPRPNEKRKSMDGKSI